jgi:hypothetical protein
MHACIHIIIALHQNFLNLSYWLFESNHFPTISMLTREKITIFEKKIKPIWSFLQKFQIKQKTEKVLIKKMERAAGQHSGPSWETAHGPTTTPPESLCASLLSIADRASPRIIPPRRS